jgi:hypothetical protein
MTKPTPRKSATGAHPAHHDHATDAEVVEHTTEDVFHAFKKGRADAVEAARNTVPMIKKSVSKGTYMSCYYLAFAAVYTAELAMSAVPEDSPIRNGFKDGASAAKDVYVQRKSVHLEPSHEPSPA